MAVGESKSPMRGVQFHWMNFNAGSNRWIQWVLCNKCILLAQIQAKLFRYQSSKQVSISLLHDVADTQRQAVNKRHTSFMRVTVSCLAVMPRWTWLARYLDTPSQWIIAGSTTAFRTLTTMERTLVVILVSLLSAFVIDAQPMAGEDELSGPRDVKAYVGTRGGGIRLYHDRPPPPGKSGREKTGQIEVRIGKIREEGGNYTDDDDRPPPGQGPPRPPRRPKMDNLREVNFEVTRKQ